jgi:hypothetical protein
MNGKVLVEFSKTGYVSSGIFRRYAFGNLKFNSFHLVTISAYRLSDTCQNPVISFPKTWFLYLPESRLTMRGLWIDPS